MKWTNKYNLPQPLVDAVINDLYDKVGDISVTGLIKPPRIRILEKRHDAEIEQDASDAIWRLIGSIGHKILERANTDNHLAEERITTELHGWTISGKADLLSPDMVLDDYKFTSVYAVMLEDKKEWEGQVNLYAWLYRRNGFAAVMGRIIAVLRDWSKPRSEREQDYPKVGVMVKEIPLWSIEEQEAFVGERVRLHQRCEKLTDDELPECTEEERWQRKNIWALKKKDGKRAIRLFTSENEAGLYAKVNFYNELGKYEVEFRQGASVRCQSYCAAAPFCNQWARIKPEGLVEEEVAA